LSGPDRFRGFPPAAFEFYVGLTAGNSRQYWAANHAIYEESVRAPVQALLDDIAGEFGGRAVIFRPNRDTRFSSDKSPYKTHQGGFAEVADGIGYHLQLDAAGLLVSGGFHAHDATQTARYRAAVTQQGPGERLAAITATLVAGGFDLDGEQVSTRPRGIAPDHPRLDLVRRKWLTAARRHPPSQELTSPSAQAIVRQDWAALAQLVAWAAEYCA
jgi:uncharacterized protein (TIGR02453 family)